MQAAGALGLIGSVVSGVGGLMGSNLQAEQADLQAKAGRIKADQVAAAHTDQLNRTIANVRAIRASADMPASPTEDAILAREEKVSLRNKRAEVGGILSQAAADQGEASLYRAAGPINFASSIIGGLGSLYG